MQRLPNCGADHTSDERTALPLIAPTVHHASGPSHPFGGSNALVQPFDLSPASGGSRNSRPSCPRDKPDSNALGPGPGSVSPGREDGSGERRPQQGGALYRRAGDAERLQDRPALPSYG